MIMTQEAQEVERVHAGKMRAWLNDAESMTDLAFWTAAAAPVHHLHCSLFLSSSLQAHKEDLQGKAVWSFSREGSLPKCMVRDYSSCLQCLHESYHTLWALPIALYGEAWSWSTATLTKAFTIVNLIRGNIWCRFNLRMASYPLALAGVADPENDRPRRVALAEAFVAKDACCLDNDYSLKLKSYIRTATDLVDDEAIASFLRESLDGLVASTSHIEDGFAHMRRLLQSSHRPPGMASLSSQHSLCEHKRIHSKWLSAQQPETLKPTPKQLANKRPIWADKKKQHGRSEANGFHAFVSASYARATHDLRLEHLSKSERHAQVLKSLGQSWRSLSEADRSRLANLKT